MSALELKLEIALLCLVFGCGWQTRRFQSSRHEHVTRLMCTRCGIYNDMFSAQMAMTSADLASHVIIMTVGMDLAKLLSCVIKTYVNTCIELLKWLVPYE